MQFSMFFHSYIIESPAVHVSVLFSLFKLSYLSFFCSLLVATVMRVQFKTVVNIVSCRTAAWVY